MRPLRRFFSSGQNWLGFLLVLLFLLTALFAPWISPLAKKDPGIYQRVGHTRLEILDKTPHPPSDIAPLGTLPGQYDVFHTLVWGTRDALLFGLSVVLLAGLIGVVFGAVSGYAGGFINNLMMRISDAFLVFPPVAAVVFLNQLMGIAVEAAGGVFIFGRVIVGQIVDNTGPQAITVDLVGPPTPIQILLGLINPLMLSLILFTWMPYARLVNSMVISIKKSEYIQASRALGASHARTIFRHVIPNSIAPALVLMSRDIGSVVILQATLTFIRLGGNSPWGDMLSMGRDWVIGPGGGILAYWWVFIPATLAIMLFGIAWNLLGDGLNDLLDPTAHYEYQRESFGIRLFGKGKTKTPSVKNESASTPDILTFSDNMQVSQPVPVNKMPSSKDNESILFLARDQLAYGELPQALHAYRHLIQHGRLMNKVLPDLALLVRKYPHEPQVWQILGDALTCSGDSEHAAQSYERAHKLMNL